MPEPENDRLNLLVNIRSERDGAVKVQSIALRKGRRIDILLLTLSTLTAGGFWYLCSSAGPHWLATSVKWVGAFLSTICAFLTAYKDRVTNFRKLGDEVTEHIRSLEKLIFKVEEGHSLTEIREEYRDIRADLHRIAAEMDRTERAPSHFLPMSMGGPQPRELEHCPVCSIYQRPGAIFCLRCGANVKLSAKENLERPHFVSVSSLGVERIAYILSDDEVSVGRTLDNSFAIEHPSVSKRHAKLMVVEDAYMLYDLESTNGTFVNGKRVKESKLADGYAVRFGRAQFVYRAQAGRTADISPDSELSVQKSAQLKIIDDDTLQLALATIDYHPIMAPTRSSQGQDPSSVADTEILGESQSADDLDRNCTSSESMPKTQ